MFDYIEHFHFLFFSSESVGGPYSETLQADMTLVKIYEWEGQFDSRPFTSYHRWPDELSQLESLFCFCADMLILSKVHFLIYKYVCITLYTLQCTQSLYKQGLKCSRFILCG